MRVFAKFAGQTNFRGENAWVRPKKGTIPSATGVFFAQPGKFGKLSEMLTFRQRSALAR